MVAVIVAVVAGVVRPAAQEVRRAVPSRSARWSSGWRPRFCRRGSWRAPASWRCGRSSGAILAAGVAAGARPDAPPRAWRALVALLCSVPAVVIVWPLVDALFGTMGLAPESGAAMGALTALGLGARRDSDGVHRGAPPMVAGRDRRHHRSRVPGCRGERNALLGSSSQAGEPLLRDGCRRAEGELGREGEPDRRVDRPVPRSLAEEGPAAGARAAVVVGRWRAGIPERRGACRQPARAAGCAPQRRSDRGRTQRHLPRDAGTRGRRTLGLGQRRARPRRLRGRQADRRHDARFGRRTTPPGR